ncbi:arsenate reductase [Methyloceanibacter marginalis]|uniref:Arsenate reductase n=1 Tax=Methyloceanibacter marginalis TaxID=1774971 RepID=A0A1E3WB49_9HYPH|nr:arsenate reductase [Methyloceanibacter marginalis]
MGGKATPGTRRVTVTIYHNPRCSKSRQTLALIEDQGIAPKVVDYLKAPPTVAELKNVLKKLGLRARDIVRKSEARYASSGKERDVGDDELLALMVENPILIERPIVVSGDKAAIGRPPEAVLDIL